MDSAGKTKSENCSGDIKFSRTYQVELAFPNIAIGEDGAKGTWTMISNQGFEVWVGGRIFFAFSYYEQVGDKVTSFCSRTFGGWYHNEDVTNWGCYVGKRVGPTISRVTYDKQSPVRQQKHINDAAFIDAINQQQSLWVATAYPHMEEMTIEEVELRAGIPASEFAFPDPNPNVPVGAVAEEEVNFDWRNVSGVNYDSPVRNQGRCGSCYSFASMGVLESRIRILTNNTQKPILSPQDAVSCSEYAQGCNGGFNYLIGGKYAYDFGVVEEDCFPYTASNSDCSLRCSNPARVWRSRSYEYIGGFYGGCNEPLMREELRKNGPIAVSIRVYPDFQQYKGGIYKHTNVVTFNPYMITSHAVILVGYGEENGVKYWIGKNSWGPEWGEKGYFRIVRGTNECAVESAGIAYIPIV